MEDRSITYILFPSLINVRFHLSTSIIRRRESAVSLSTGDIGRRSVATDDVAPYRHQIESRLIRRLHMAGRRKQFAYGCHIHDTILVVLYDYPKPNRE